MQLQSPITPFIENQGVLLLDGGLATELQQQGYVLDTPLWSAHLLQSNPEAIRRVHISYLEAGADCITSASYQASIAGFLSAGFSLHEAEDQLKMSVTLATNARDEFIQTSNYMGSDRLRPLVAASIGPYGAYLANGAEYTGEYNVSIDELRAFHEQRWEILASTSADILACETIPNIREAEILRDLIQQTPDIFAWVSFSCRDNVSISDGTLLKECAMLFKECDQVVAIGVNCTAPKLITSLIMQVRTIAPSKHIIVYPNSGELYDKENRIWTTNSEPLVCGIEANKWFENGATLIGGCCRIGPRHIKAMRKAIMEGRVLS